MINKNHFYRASALILLLFLVTGFSLAGTINGVVQNAQGEKLAGVTISVKSTTSTFSRTSSTNAEGAFSITETPEGESFNLTFSYIGYSPFTQENVTVSNNGTTTLSIVLTENFNEIEDVVVVGFGTQRKVNLTGAVQAIDAEDLQDRPVTNVSTALQGKFAGVTIIQNSGQPGKDGGSIRIRGLGTINNSNPLVIVDGIESSMNNINPNDIENISVLKDGPSAAIYGSKAANGVILVTTKRGRQGEPKFDYSGYVGWQSPTRLPEYMGSYDHAVILNEALENEGRTPVYNEQDLEGFRTGSDPYRYPNTDWLGLLYSGSGLQQSHNVQMSGATEKFNYMASLGYLDQDGVIPIASSDRYNLRTNIGGNITERLKVDIGLAYNYQRINEPVNPYTGDMSQIFRQVNRIPSFIPYKYENGQYGNYSDGNPIAWLDMASVDRVINKQTQINISGEYQILEGLKFKQIVGFQPFDNSSSKFVKAIQYYNADGTPRGGPQGTNNLTVSGYQLERLTMQSLLTYDKLIGRNQINALAGFMDETFRADFVSAYRVGFLGTDLEELAVGNLDGQTGTSNAKKNILRSWFGRLNYAFDGKYLLEGNIRHDGTSRFTGANRWSTFPSFSAGWRISQEGFFQNSNLAQHITELKLRGGWGILGNQTLFAVGENSYPTSDPYYPTLEVFTSGYNYPFNNSITTGGVVVTPANPILRWEETVSTNIGLDLNLRNNWSFVLDYFDRKTNDMLLTPPIPITFGASSAPYENAGKGRNRGVELQATYSNNSGEFTYDISANASYIKNELTQWRLPLEPHSSYYVYEIGSPMRAFYGYETLGIYRSDEEYLNSGVTGVNGNIGAGDLIYKDQNNDGKIDGNDRVYLGSPDPKYIFGLTANFTFRDFDLNMFWQGAADVKGYLWGEAIGSISGSDKPTTIYNDRFHETKNPNGSIPRALTSWEQNNPGSYPSDFWLQDASYLRLKNITLGYNIPKTFLSRIGLKGAKVYYSGQNLLTFTSFAKGFDPEAPAGSRGNYYPQVKTNSFGLNVNF